MGTGSVRNIKQINYTDPFDSLTVIEEGLLSPYAGGYLHRILSYPPEKWTHIALVILIEYLSITSLLIFVFIIFKYPCHWTILSIEGICLVFYKWFSIRFFLYDNGNVSLVSFFSLILIPFCIIIFSWLFDNIVRRKVRR
jgi:hypothetical protein